MPKRWILCGVWVVLLLCGRNAIAEGGVAPAVDPVGEAIKDYSIKNTSSMLLAAVTVTEAVPTIDDVIVQGNRRMSTEQIKEKLHSCPGKKYLRSTVDEDVRELYKTNQFINIQTLVQADGKERVKIYFVVRELPNLVEKIAFRGAKLFSDEELCEITGIRSGTPLMPLRNRLGCRKILDQYEAAGRPFAQCELVKGGDLSDTEVLYRIAEGPKPVIRKIEFTGNTFVTASRLRQIIIPLRIEECYTPLLGEVALNEYHRFYRDAGYYDVRIDLETQRDKEGSRITLIYHIQEGPRYRLAQQAEIVGPKSLPLDCLQMLVQLKKGDYVRNGSVLADIHRIEEYCRSRHRPVNVEAFPVWIEDRPGWANVQYEIEELHYHIGKIRVRGNKRISTESILAHVHLTPGQHFTYEQLQQAEKKLAELGPFVVDAATKVRPMIAMVDHEFDKEEKDLVIEVKEKPKAKR